MPAHSDLPESFQKLLSDAFAMPENGIDAESLAAMVELQRAIAAGEADVDQTMDLIAARAGSVADATGTAIGLLQGDQLVYRAGNGTGAAYVGQHVMATLSVSGDKAASGEILRVENAQTDRRIEGAICRQFGARSLLILPIYHEGRMAGVLDLLFDKAHSFQPREVLTYRLMAALVGEAMYYSALAEPRKALVADLSTMQQSIPLIPPHREEALNGLASMPAAAANGAIYEVFRTLIARAGKLPALAHSAWAMLKRAKRLPWHTGRWETAVGVTAVLIIACWIGFRDRHPAMPMGVSGLQGSTTTLEQPMPVASAKRVLANSTSMPQTALGLEPGERKKRKTSRSIPQGVQDRNVRIRYISDDVTIRYFTPKPPTQLVLDRNIRVRYISDDVTVRYFTRNPAVAPVPSPTGHPPQPVSR